jgi:hypothetical protein
MPSGMWCSIPPTLAKQNVPFSSPHFSSVLQKDLLCPQSYNIGGFLLFTEDRVELYTLRDEQAYQVAVLVSEQPYTPWIPDKAHLALDALVNRYITTVQQVRNSLSFSSLSPLFAYLMSLRLYQKPSRTSRVLWLADAIIIIVQNTLEVQICLFNKSDGLQLPFLFETPTKKTEDPWGMATLGGNPHDPEYLLINRGNHIYVWKLPNAASRLQCWQARRAEMETGQSEEAPHNMISIRVPLISSFTIPPPRLIQFEAGHSQVRNSSPPHLLISPVTSHSHLPHHTQSPLHCIMC